MFPDIGRINLVSGASTLAEHRKQDALTAPEAANLFSSVSQFNAATRPFPAFPGTASSDATLNTPFGSALSLDGIHPSASTHRLVAGALIAASNQAFEKSIPALQ
ncbi:MAG: hypothetical protein V3T28_06400 [Gemmatimonadales bacterium]